MRLPTFLVIGAHKCGTSSLWSFLKNHPDVDPSRVKEIRFFDSNYDRGLDWYAAQFPSSGAPQAGEASPSYLTSVEAAARIAATLPDVRLLCSLRNPVDRLYSAYWSETARGRQAQPFEAFLASLGALVDEGVYVEHLRRYEHLFGRSALHVVFLEEMATAPGTVLAGVCRFLAIDEAPPRGMTVERVNAYQRFRSLRVRAVSQRLPKRARDLVGRLNRVDAAYPPMEPPTRARLVETYRAPNAALRDWLGRPLPAGWDG